MQLTITMTVNYQKHLAVLYLNGTLCAANTYQLKNAFQEVLQAIPKGQIILDCEHLKGINSNGLKCYWNISSNSEDCQDCDDKAL